MRLLLATLIGLSACAPEAVTPGLDATGEDCTLGLDPGQCAPDFTLTGSDGVDLRLSTLQGKRVIVLGSSNW